MNNKDIEKLLDQAGPRVKPDAAVRDQVYQEVHDMWLKTHQPPFYRAHAMKIAASLLLFVSLFSVTFFQQGEQPNFNIADSIQMQGQIQISQNNVDWHNLGHEQKISPGDFIKTKPNNRLMIKLFNGNKIRVNENTLIEITGTDQFKLLSGAVYIDSNERGGHHKLTVLTPLAAVNHIGTRYSVTYQNDALNVDVRNGMVLVSGDQLEQSEIEQGEAFVMNSEGEIAYDEIDTFDPKWQWTQKIAEHFAIQDKSVYEYLQWVSSESGYPLNWATDAARNKAASVRLSGSINGIMPIDSLDVIIPTTRFSYSLENNQIYIHSDNG